MLSNKRKKSGFVTDVLPMIGLCALIVVIGTVCVIGANMMDNAIKRCSEEIAVGHGNVSTTSELVAPYHGGRVFTRYSHSTTYSWEVNGEKYSFRASMSMTRTPTWEFPGIIIIRYNPENPDEYWIDCKEITDLIGGAVYPDRSTGRPLPSSYYQK